MPHPSVEIVHPFRFSKELQETAVSESSPWSRLAPRETSTNSV